MSETNPVNKWLVTLTVMLPTLIVIVDTSIVNVSLDHIRGSLSAGIDESTWPITAYLVSNAIVIPMSGWLSRLLGRKFYLISSIVLFTVSSLLCGAAWSIESLVFFRVLQGIGGGGLQPISQAILLETYPPHQYGIAMAIFGMGVMVGPIIGPLLGGWITENWSWQWIFYVNVPIGILSIVMAVFFIFDPHYAQRIKMKIDYWGLSLLAVGLGCLQMVLDRGQREDWLSSDLIIWLGLTAFVCLILLIVVEFTTEQPIIDLKVFRNATFSMCNVVAFFTFFNLFGSIILLPIYLQTLMGYTALLAGLVLGPGGIAAILSMQLAGRLVVRMSPKVVLASGTLMVAYSTYLMSHFNLQADFWTILWPRVFMGFGMGFVFIPLTTLMMTGVRKEDMGNATAVFSLIRNLGASFGIAFVSTLISRRAQFHQVRLSEHFTPFDTAFQMAQEKLAITMRYRGIVSSGADQGSLAAIYSRVIKEASMMSFNDAFYLLTLFLIAVVPLVFFMKRALPAGQKAMGSK